MKKDDKIEVQITKQIGRQKAPGSHSFPIGHPRFFGSGRVPGSKNRQTREAIASVEATGFHPAAFLATCAMTGMMPNVDGSSTPISAKERLKAAISLCPYLMPRLLASQVTNVDDPVDRAIDLSAIMQDPALVEKAQDLAIALAQADTAPSPDPRSPVAGSGAGRDRGGPG